MLFVRNFEIHQVINRIELSGPARPMMMQLMPGNLPFIAVALSDQSLKLIDYLNEENQTEIETLHEEITVMKVCPNGKYILTAGNRGDVLLWNVNKKILTPEVLDDAYRTANV